MTLLIGGRYKDEYVFDLDLTVKDTGRGIKKEDIDKEQPYLLKTNYSKKVDINTTSLETENGCE